MIRRLRLIAIAFAAQAMTAACGSSEHSGRQRYDGGIYVMPGIAPPTLDVLVVIDDSTGMDEAQTRLGPFLRDVLERLAAPPDEDGDRVRDWNTVRNVQIGVVSTDMGSGGQPFPGCTEPERGDDGLLQHEPADSEECVGPYASPLAWDAFDPYGEPLEAVEDDFGCIARLGTSGCIFSQPLAAAVKALTGYDDWSEPNYWLYRGGLLLILIVTNEDDCSAASPDFFETSIPDGLRCTERAADLRAVADLAEVLAARPFDPEMTTVALLAGVPPDLVGSGTIELEPILADPRMTPRPDGEVLASSCDTAAGPATPPRRLVEWLEAMSGRGAGTIVGSLCSDDWSSTAEALAREVGVLVWDFCLINPPFVGPEGQPLQTGDRLDCIVREVMPGGDCRPGRIPVGVDERGHSLCHLCQRGDGAPPFDRDYDGNDLSACLESDAFWFFSTEDPSCAFTGTIEVSLEGEPAEGVTFDTECRNPRFVYED